MKPIVGISSRELPHLGVGGGALDRYGFFLVLAKGIQYAKSCDGGYSNLKAEIDKPSQDLYLQAHHEYLPNFHQNSITRRPRFIPSLEI